MRARNTMSRWLLCCGLTCIAAVSMAWPRYSYTDVGPPGGNTWGSAINNSGGLSVKTEIDVNMGFCLLWQDQSLTQLNLPGNTSIGWSINDNGAIAGSWNSNWQGSHGFIWQSNVVTDLAPVDGQTSSEAYGLNNAGVAVGHSGPVATMWVDGQALPILGTLDGAEAWGVNNLGQVVGQTLVNGSIYPQPFLYQNGQLSMLPLPGGVNGAYAFSINDHGHIVGNYHGEKSFIWTDPPFTQPTDLGNLGPVYTGAGALAINNYDQVVGFALKQELPVEFGSAILWDRGQMVDLNTLVINAGRMNVYQARGINDDGVIVGNASDEAGTLRACLLTPIVDLDSLALNPNTVLAGATSTATLTMDGRVPMVAIPVQLSSSNPLAASVPQTVIVPRHASSITFPVTTYSVNVDTRVTITATYNGNSVTASLLVQSILPHMNGFTLSQNTVYAGTVVTGTVTMNHPAPSGGLRVALTNSNTSAATGPTSVTIAQGTTSKSFTIQTLQVSSPQQATFTATAGPYTLRQTLAVTPITIQSLQFAASSVTGGMSVNGVLRIAAPAPSSGFVITLTSGYPNVAKPPATVTVPHGATSVTFSMTTYPVAQSYFVTITAAHGPSTANAQIQVLPPEVSAFRLSATRVKGGTHVTGTVTLNGKAPTGGILVHITANPNLALPATDVIVRAGSTSASFTLNTSTVSVITVVNVSARTLNVTKSVALTLTP